MKPRIGRLAVQFGLAFALAMAGAGGLLYWLARAQIDKEVDTSLRRERARIMVPGGARRLAATTGRRVISDKAHLVLAPDGRLLWGRIEMAMPPVGLATVLFRDGRPDWREGRALTTLLPDGARMVIIEHSEAVENIHAILPTAAIVLIVISIVVGSGAAWVFSALIAQRLTRTMNTADALARGDLSRRIPDEGLDGVFAQQVLGLNRMIDRMADMVRSQRQFASHLAHDLRTPLTRLRALLQAEREQTDAAEHHRLERAERECRSIIAIFDALLRLSEIEAGRHPTAMAPLLLGPIMEDVAETMEPVIADAGSQLTVRAVAPATDTTAFSGTLVNIGTVHYKGVEGQIAYMPIESLTLFGNGSYNYAHSGTTHAQVAKAPITTAAAGFIYNHKGLRVSFSQKFTGPQFATELFTVKASVNGVPTSVTQFATTDGIRLYRISPYSTGEFAISQEIGTHLRLGATVSNVFNSRAITAIANGGTTLVGGKTYYAGADQFSFLPPRSFMVDVRVTY